MGLPRSITGESVDSTRDYLNQIGRRELIDADREVELALLVRASQAAGSILQTIEEDGEVEIETIPFYSLDVDMVSAQAILDGTDARQEFAEANLRMVVSIAKKYIGYGLSLDDLIQEGNIGLLEAIEKFDPDMGFRFYTVARWWIRNAINKGLENSGRTIRIPRNHYDLLAKYKKTRQRVESENPTLGKKAITIMCAEKMNLSVEDIEDLEISEYMIKHPVSLDMRVGENDGATIGDLIGRDDESLNAAQNASLSIEELVKDLKPRDAEVIRLHYVEGRSFSEIGERLGVKRQMVQQIEKRVRYRIGCDILRGKHRIDPEESPGLSGVIAKERAKRDAAFKPRPIDHPLIY